MNPNNSKNNKLFNRNAVLSMLALNAPISRIELANRTGLSKMSLTNIINEFSELGYIKEAGIDLSCTGKKKPRLLEPLLMPAWISAGLQEIPDWKVWVTTSEGMKYELA